MSRRSHRFALLLAGAGLVLTGCGSSEPPQRLERIDPVVPSDLCASLPEDATTGLETSATTDETGDPTASCSLRSEFGDETDVRGLVTLIALNDEETADSTYESQCRAVDHRDYSDAEVSLESAEEVCAAEGKKGDSAILNAVSGTRLVTVRFESTPPGKPDALTRATELAQAALESSGSSS